MASMFTKSILALVKDAFSKQSAILPMGYLNLRQGKLVSVAFAQDPTDAQVDKTLDAALTSFPMASGYAVFYEARIVAHGVPFPPNVRPLSDTVPRMGVSVVRTPPPDAPQRCVFVIFVSKSRPPEMYFLPVHDGRSLGDPEDVSHLYEVPHVRPPFKPN